MAGFAGILLAGFLELPLWNVMISDNYHSFFGDRPGIRLYRHNHHPPRGLLKIAVVIPAGKR